MMRNNSLKFMKKIVNLVLILYCFLRHQKYLIL